MIKIIEKPELPKEIAQAKAPAVLMSQAVRVFLANQRQGTQSALTRAEVNRTRKKIFKQKGTGHARHGDRKAPIFVGGGIAFAPKPRDYSLSLPAKMSKLARFGAMLAKSKDHGLVVVSGLGQIDGKTSTVSKFLSEVSKEQVKFLLVTDVVRDNVYRAARNIRDCEVTTWGQVNTYQILRADKVIVMQEAFENKVEKNEEEPKVEKSEKKAVVKKVVKAKK